MTDFDTWWMSLPPCERVDILAACAESPMTGIKRAFKAAGKDGMRLDWLDRWCGKTFGNPKNETPDGMEWTLSSETNDIRHAIDAAIAAQAQKKEQP